MAEWSSWVGRIREADDTVTAGMIEGLRATLDSEENYLIKKFFTAAGAVSIENQARI